VTPQNDTPPDRRALEAAFLSTTYWVDTPDGRLGIRVAQCHPQLDRLLERHGCRTWAYLTAHNPGSVRLSSAENHRRNQGLEEEVSRLGLVCFGGEGVGADESWPPELSLLILGIEPDAALALAEEHSQLAIVCGNANGPARLLWTSLPQ